MRILFKDKGEALACVEATYIAYDTEKKALVFYDTGYEWEIQIAQSYAEARIREAYKDGCTEIESYEEWE